MVLGIVWITDGAAERVNPLTHWVGRVLVSFQENVMAYSANRLPSRFPVGTKFVIESHRGKEGQVYSQFLEFPDGTFLPLPSRKPRKSSERRTRGGRH